jgi:hypothetical protein
LYQQLAAIREGISHGRRPTCACSNHFATAAEAAQADTDDERPLDGSVEDETIDAVHLDDVEGTEDIDVYERESFGNDVFQLPDRKMIPAYEYLGAEWGKRIVWSFLCCSVHRELANAVALLK